VNHTSVTMDTHADDQVSISSSCEIVDALLEASEDMVKEDVTKDTDEKEGSPSFEIADAMSTSQYAQVIFNDIEDSYPIDLDLTCRYTLTPGLEAGHGDRIALYRLPYLQPHEYVGYVWTKITQEAEMQVVFPHKSLPKEEDFYQFQYLKGDNSVAGASIPFQLRAPGQSSQEVCGVREEGDLMVVQTPHTSLQEKAADMESKYTGMLELSEQLTDELNLKTQSFIILEQEHKSLLGTVTRCQQLEGDLQKLVAEKLQLEQTLTQTTETLGQTDRVLQATTARLEGVEKTLKVKMEEVSKLEMDFASIQSKCVGISAQNKALIDEKENLAKMLDQEIQARESLLTEKKELVDRMDDLSNMLNAAAKSKELAVEEIRAQIQQQDKLRQDLAVAKEEAGNAEAELVLLRQKLSNHEAKGEDSFVVASVMSSLGAKLEAKEREVMQKNEELEILRSRETNMSSMEIHEICIKDADKRAENLEKKNQDITKENEMLKHKVNQLEKDKSDLVKRLEAGAAHYRKLAAEKSTWEKAKSFENSGVTDKYTMKIDSLESKIVQLSEELRAARLEQDMKLSQISKDISQNSSSNSSTTTTRDQYSMISNISGESNMNSVKINDAVTNSNRTPIVKMPSLFHPFPPKSEIVPDADPSLPTPLLPENIDPTVLIPELQPREPAPYSSIGCAGDSAEQSVENPVEAEPQKAELECPMCDEKFGGECHEALQQHVDQHLESVVECPLCGKTYDKKNQTLYEDHVQDHFTEQAQSLEIRGWDLGID